MHLKVLVDDTCPGNSARVMTVGQQYLTSLRESAGRQRERQSKARALSIQMHRMFLPIAEEVTCKRMDSGKLLLDIAHLIDNKTVERYQNKYTSATTELKGLPHAAVRPLAPVPLRAEALRRRSPRLDCNTAIRGSDNLFWAPGFPSCHPFTRHRNTSTSFESYVLGNSSSAPRLSGVTLLSAISAR